MHHTCCQKYVTTDLQNHSTQHLYCGVASRPNRLSVNPFTSGQQAASHCRPGDSFDKQAQTQVRAACNCINDSSHCPLFEFTSITLVSCLSIFGAVTNVSDSALWIYAGAHSPPKEWAYEFSPHAHFGDRSNPVPRSPSPSSSESSSDTLAEYCPDHIIHVRSY